MARLPFPLKSVVHENGKFKISFECPICEGVDMWSRYLSNNDLPFEFYNMGHWRFHCKNCLWHSDMDLLRFLVAEALYKNRVK